MSVHSPCKAPPSSASSLPKVSLPLSHTYIFFCLWNFNWSWKYLFFGVN
jgi:hypothetical protein